MKYKITLACVLSAAAMNFAEGQNPAPAPTVAGCPSPLPAQNWPASSCKYQFYPLTDTTHAIASKSKTTPIYQHTYSAYGASDLLVACPAGAVTTAGSCTDSTGKDLSQVVAKSAIPGLVIAPSPPACPDTFIPMNWTCTVDATGKIATCTAPISPAS